MPLATTERPEVSLRIVSWLIAVLMLTASVAAVLLRPSSETAEGKPALLLESVVPKQFGDWREVPASQLQVINPETQELLDKLYSDVLARVYVNGGHYHIMLSVAYGSDQRGSLRAHKPEVCYPAQGFVVHQNDPGSLVTAYGDIPVRRLFATMGARQEPLTYWFTVGDKAVQNRMQHRLVELKLGLTGRVPDGLLFRVSSIDINLERAYAIQEEFVGQLLEAVDPERRRRLSGLGDL